MSSYNPFPPKPMEGGDMAVQSGDCVKGGGYGYGRLMGASVSPKAFKRTLPPSRTTAAKKFKSNNVGGSSASAAAKGGCGGALALASQPAPPARQVAAMHHPPQQVSWSSCSRTFDSYGGAYPPTAFKRTSQPQGVGINNGLFGPRFVKIVAKLYKTATGMRSLVTLPLLPNSPVWAVASSERSTRVEKVVDLKSLVEKTPQGKDYLTLQHRVPVESFVSGKLITPRPIRPIGSCIKFQLEAEIEAEDVPVIVMDSSKRVLLTNSAYNKMVGQPECMWLGSMADGRNGSERIGGEVVFKARAKAEAVEERGTAFKGRVKIYRV